MVSSGGEGVVEEVAMDRELHHRLSVVGTG